MGRQYKAGDEVPVPLPGADFWHEIVPFALAYDAYGRHRGGVHDTLEVHRSLLEGWRISGTLDASLDDLRTALFMEQRFYHDPGAGPGEPTGEERRFVDALLEAIRAASGAHVGVDPNSHSAGGWGLA